MLRVEERRGCRERRLGSGDRRGLFLPEDLCRRPPPPSPMQARRGLLPSTVPSNLAAKKRARALPQQRVVKAHYTSRCGVSPHRARQKGDQLVLDRGGWGELELRLQPLVGERIDIDRQDAGLWEETRRPCACTSCVNMHRKEGGALHDALSGSVPTLWRKVDNVGRSASIRSISAQ